MEDAQKKTQYGYKENAALVLQSERGRRDYSGAGDVQSIASKKSAGELMREMGSRARPDKDSSSKSKQDKDKHAKRPLADDDDDASRKKSRKGLGAGFGGIGSSVLSADVESVYRPLSRETRAVYETLLTLLSQEMGDQPHDVFASCADEVLTVLKDTSLGVKAQQASIEELFAHPLSADRFRQIVNIGTKVTDFKAAGASAAGDDESKMEDADGAVASSAVAASSTEALDSALGVSVVFGEDEEEEEAQDENDPDHRPRKNQAAADDDDEDEEEEDAEGEDADAAAAAKMEADGAGPTFKIERGAADANRGSKSAAAMPTSESDDADYVDARDIDAHWVQRLVSSFTADPHAAQKLASDLSSALADRNLSDAACESKLVALLDFEHFKEIKRMLKNRWKLVYAVKLALCGSGAQGEAQRASIKAEMQADPKLRAILDELARTTASAADKTSNLEANLRKEARSMEQASRAAARQAKGGDDGMEDESKDESASSSSSAAAAAASASSSSSSEKSSDAFWARRPKAVVDLESLSFAGAGHFMSNAQCTLPKNSEIINAKGYQEVHIPPLKPKPFAADEGLVSIADLPQWAQPAFAKMDKLNRIQSKVYPTAMKSPENMLVCAPTGAGKTNVAMMCMLREIGLHQKSDGTFDVDAFKIIYVAPMKSLVQEMVMNFGPRLAPFGINVAELSGDQQLNAEQIATTQVIVTTVSQRNTTQQARHEDIVTRKSGDRTYTQLVKLVIIDEVHLLHDARGATLESIVARTIRQIESTQELVRLVGLSATLPNYEDVAMFLRVRPDKGLFYFDASFRPVPLQQQYIGITVKKAFKRSQMMNEICFQKVIAEAGKNQVLVFVHSRKETATTAKSLRDQALAADELGKFVRDDARRELLAAEALNVKNAQLKELLPYGFAIHHAGMTRADRKLVEELFDAKHIQVLVCTATLAWGVNLPAHTVIIKGTQIYDAEAGGWKELSMLDIGQMSGRAGRPQHDVLGEAIILTSHKELHYYLSLLNEQLPVESQFIAKLADNLNAEIVLGTVTNVREAVSWLGYTYLYVRMLRNPSLYGISADDAEADPYLEQRRLDLVHSAATLLDRGHLIKYDRKTGAMQVTELGRVASNYYITHQSLSAFNDYLKPTLSDIELFRIFSLSSEFKNISVREEEKIELAKLLDKVPIPIKESMEEPSAKVNVLLQAYISRLNLEGFALMADLVYITQSASRICRALFEITLKRGWAGAALRCLTLCKMIDHRMWSAQSPLRQFEAKVPTDIIRRLESKDMSFEQLYDLEAPALGELVRFPKMGAVIHRAIHQLPKLELQGAVQPITRSTLRVELTITPDFQFDSTVHGNAEAFYIFVEDCDGEMLLHSEYFLLKKAYAAQEHVITFTVPIFDPMPPQYFVRVVSDRWLGSEIVLPMSFRHLLLPDKFAPPTELLDLQPISTNEIAHEKWIGFFANRMHTLNPIQTQVFNAVYKRNDNLMLAAPFGSGHSVVAELAMIRQLIAAPVGSKIVYIAPLEAIALEKYREWKASFEDKHGISVVYLPGEPGADLKLLSSGTIIISTPDRWDVLSRRWRTRKPVQDVNLMIVDELQLIAGKSGPVLEIIVSRMRYIKSQLKNDLRIIGLSASVANAKDLGEWIGASSANTFNFHPAARPVPLEIRVQSFDHSDFNSRTLAMVKPAYSAVCSLSANKPAFVFVPNKKFARSVALDFMTFAVGEERADRFLRAGGLTREQLADKLKKLHNPSLLAALCSGIGYLHENQAAEERALVENLYRAGHISLLVIEYCLCWGLALQSHMSVVLGCSQYDSSQHRYVDLPLNDVTCMLGLACRPQLDDKSVAVLFCASSKREFYKKFLYQPAPVESRLDASLADCMLAEIITKRVETKQDAVDYLTWSFLYRRLTQNPNFYGLAGTTHRHFSDHLSELIENALEDLSQAKMIAIDDSELSPLNLGMVAAYYNIHYTTVEIFSRSLQKKTKLKGLLEIVSSASEFDDLPVRPKEADALRSLARHLPLIAASADGAGFEDPHTKCNVILQSHFSRIPLSNTVAKDLSLVLPVATRLLQAMVDVLSSNGWLSPALACMELSQMITQGQWNNQPVLMQLPHFTKEIADRCAAAGVHTIPDLMELEDADRDRLLKFSPTQLMAVAQVCNSYPDIDVTYSVQDAQELHAGERCVMQVKLVRDPDDEDAEELQGVPLVASSRYPGSKTEGWWLVLGNTDTNELLSIKRVAMSARETKVNLEFTPAKQGDVKYMLYLMSGDFLGTDQEFEVPLSIREGKEESDEESMGEE